MHAVRWFAVTMRRMSFSVSCPVRPTCMRSAAWYEHEDEDEDRPDTEAAPERHPTVIMDREECRSGTCGSGSVIAPVGSSGFEEDCAWSKACNGVGLRASELRFLDVRGMPKRRCGCERPPRK